MNKNTTSPEHQEKPFLTEEDKTKAWRRLFSGDNGVNPLFESGYDAAASKANARVSELEKENFDITIQLGKLLMYQHPKELLEKISSIESELKALREESLSRTKEIVFTFCEYHDAMHSDKSFSHPPALNDRWNRWADTDKAKEILGKFKCKECEALREERDQFVRWALEQRRFIDIVEFNKLTIQDLFEQFKAYTLNTEKL